MTEFAPTGYDPADDPDLKQALETALNKWKASNPDAETATHLTKFVLVVRADGWDAEGKEVSQVMLVPYGSEEDCLGLLASADTRMKAMLVAGILERE
ncbi:hypothetical protein SEA_EDGARPOE_109 [Arthrobacter phage EdgarPoe]|uniref:Uncharacterized protein n=2 Tax=Klausavirus princesstrina TaxID=1984784 RepID=A0A1J0GRN9_9CAUD|nr:hypothetical protein SEA_CONBOY_109 [Arthrobacter phage Conboy]APC44792.1 hypothetical protein SEA_EDGARPOE_109 [Arthrobacter phage EdgarPoe]